jgi:hypothetical protein
MSATVAGMWRVLGVVAFFAAVVVAAGLVAFVLNA